MKAINIGANDEVIVASNAYIACWLSISNVGAKIVPVEPDLDTFNIDPDSFKQAISEALDAGLNPSVVIPVDLFGQPADIDTISLIASENKMKVLIDGAQSFGGVSHGRRVGSMGDATTTSFFPAKPLGCYGDGGAIFLQDDIDAEVINSIRLHGKGSHKYEHIRIGLNSRMDTIQAAILIEKLKILPNELNARDKIASKYSECLSPHLKTPKCEKNLKSAWAQYTLFLENRDLIQTKLKAKNIPSVVYYPIPLSKQRGYKHYPSVSTGLGVSNLLSENFEIYKNLKDFFLKIYLKNFY